MGKTVQDFFLLVVCLSASSALKMDSMDNGPIDLDGVLLLFCNVDTVINCHSSIIFICSDGWIFQTISDKPIFSVTGY